MIDLDKTDHAIIRELQKNARITNADLAEAVNLSASACLRRTKRLEEEQVISRYAAHLNAPLLNLGRPVYVEITLLDQKEDSLQEFERAATACDEIMECYLMSGDADYLVRVQARDAADYERIHRQYLARLPHVARIKSSFTLRTICRRQIKLR